ncbi:MAG: amidohydrolase [Syntrophaceae bacterium]|nr:amidohydrolase [Syntrophaceae bacterium]
MKAKKAKTKTAREGLFPDVLYLNGTILTMAETPCGAEAVATLGDKIVAVGKKAIIRKMAGPATKVVDLAGKTLVSGLNEPHNHFGVYGIYALRMVNLQSPPLGPVTKIKDLIEVLKEKAGKTPKGEWVGGRGYDDTLMAEKKHPTRQDLDQASTLHPIFITHVSGHLSVANSKALEIAGITKDTVEPAGGVIRKDPNTLEPDGVLEEMPAQALVFRHLPPVTMDLRLEGMGLAARDYLQAGVTSCSDAGVVFPGVGNPSEILAYQRAIKEGLVPIRITMMVGVEYLLGPDGRSPSFVTGFGDDCLKIGPAKIIVDGSIQGYTGWLSTPYYVPFRGDSSYRGYPVTAPEKLNRLVLEAHKAGCQIAAHGNGDAAIDAILDAYELAHKKFPRPDSRHRIEHCQMAREDQLDRMAELGVSPSFFASHTYYWGDRHKSIFMGPERAVRISPLKTALKRGIRFTLHSDCPVTPVSPLFCVFAAVNRMTRNGEVLGPEFRLTPEEALRAVTIDAAWQTFDEKIKGSIEVGKLADFTILAENPLSVPPERIKDIGVREVIIAGKSVYKAD